MKKLFITIFLIVFNGVSYSEEIKIICDYVEGSERTGWEYGKTHVITTIHFGSDSVFMKIDLDKKIVHINDGGILPNIAYLRGNEIFFTTKVNVNLENPSNAITENHQVFKFWDEGTINRETGEMTVTNYSEQKDDRGFEFGSEKKYLCRNNNNKF